MYQETALWRQMGKELQRYTKLETKKALHSGCSESQAALEHGLARIHRTVGFSGACSPFLFLQNKIFKGQAILHLQDLHPDHTNDFPNHLRMKRIQALHSLRNFQCKTTPWKKTINIMICNFFQKKKENSCSLPKIWEKLGRNVKHVDFDQNYCFQLHICYLNVAITKMGTWKLGWKTLCTEFQTNLAVQSPTAQTIFF